MTAFSLFVPSVSLPDAQTALRAHVRLLVLAIHARHGLLMLNLTPTELAELDRWITMGPSDEDSLPNDSAETVALKVMYGFHLTREELVTHGLLTAPTDGKVH